MIHVVVSQRKDASRCSPTRPTTLMAFTDSGRVASSQDQVTHDPIGVPVGGRNGRPKCSGKVDQRTYSKDEHLIPGRMSNEYCRDGPSTGIDRGASQLIVTGNTI